MGERRQEGSTWSCIKERNLEEKKSREELTCYLSKTPEWMSLNVHAWMIL